MRPRPAIERFTEKYLANEAGCWLWQGFVDPKGYGRFKTPGEIRAHRWSYSYFVGPIPDGLVIDHVCRVRHCVNPEHLRAVTSAENTMAPGSEAPAKVLSETETCIKGHAWTIENTRYDGAGRRQCRACANERNRAARRAARAATCPLGHDRVPSVGGRLLYCPICHREACLKRSRRRTADDSAA